MTGRQDRRIEFHARSAEHKKEFEAKLKETGQTKSEFLRAFMDEVVSGRDDGEERQIDPAPKLCEECPEDYLEHEGGRDGVIEV
ncbi:MAG: hypothetical protein QF834_06830, partial [Candidatus Thalassarchaeaceae archaeon]|nr:hypothetical protein [Candidatus Thalassarchaeaceae archaeon]